MPPSRSVTFALILNRVPTGYPFLIRAEHSTFIVVGRPCPATGRARIRSAAGSPLFSYVSTTTVMYGLSFAMPDQTIQTRRAEAISAATPAV